MNVREAELRIETLNDMKETLLKSIHFFENINSSFEIKILQQIYKKLERERDFISETLRQIEYPIKEDYGFWEENK